MSTAIRIRLIWPRYMVRNTGSVSSPAAAPSSAPPEMTVHLKNGWLQDPDLWDINSIGDFTHNNLDYSIAILTSNDPDMAYGVDTVEAIARLINKALAEGDADAAPAPEPFRHLLCMQRRFPG